MFKTNLHEKQALFLASVSVVVAAVQTAAADPKECYRLAGAKWCAVADGLHKIPVRDHTPARWPVTAALAAWNYAAPTNQMHLHKVNSGQYVDYYAGSHGKSGWLGLTVYSMKDHCFDKGMTVTFNDSYQDDSPSYGWTSQIANHETGHVIGLTHSDVCQTLMWSEVPTCTRTAEVSHCDALGAAVIYP